MEKITRRNFVLASMAAAVAGVSGGRLHGQAWRHRWNEQTDPEAVGVSAYLNHSNLFVRYENMPLLTYRAHSTQKYPYFMPLSGPATGISLVSESGLPYPHHRGLWLGCEPLEGGDYWGDTALSTGQIRSTDLKLEGVSEGVVTFTDHCQWVREGAPSPLEDRRTFKVHVPNDDVYVLDCELAITAQIDIQIKRAKHSFFAIRSAPDIAPTYGGTLMNSEGATGAEGTYGKPAKWCSYFGPRRLRPDVVEGITIMNHPENFGGDCPWFTRDYGHMSAQPFEFLDKPYRLAEGETLNLKYRVVMHAGTPKDAGMDAIYQQWLQ